MKFKERKLIIKLIISVISRENEKKCRSIHKSKLVHTYGSDT